MNLWFLNRLFSFSHICLMLLHMKREQIQIFRLLMEDEHACTYYQFCFFSEER